MRRSRPFIRKLAFSAAVTLAFTLVAQIVMLASHVSRDLGRLAYARSDNVQWTLSQVEVEFLEFQAALAPREPGERVDLRRLRREFDIFYSRLRTLESSAVFAPLRDVPAFDDNRLIAQDFVEGLVPLIDGADAALVSALPKVRLASMDVRSRIRDLAGSGLTIFAEIEDDRRAGVFATLSHLARLVGGLLLALVCLFVFLVRLNALNVRRRRQIAQTSERMNTVIETSLDAVIVSDTKGYIMEFNSAAEAIFGYAAQEARGRDLASLIIPNELRAAHAMGMKRMLETGEKKVVGTGRIRLTAKRSNGDVFPVELAIQTAETGNETIFIAFLRDVSDRVAAEAALMQARDRALASEKMKTDFLAVMSHEIRTPLNGLLGNLTLLRATSLDEAQARYTRNMETSGRLLMNHITDVLDITKYDAGKLELRKEPMSLSALVQDIVDTQTGPATANHSVIDWRWVNSPIEWINADESRLQNVLMNLVSNAVKFTKSGRISVELESQTAQDGSPMVEFRVIDTGIGMDADLKQRVFQDFVAGNTAYDREVGGTGLGLGIAKRFATALDGTIGVESEPGMGSTFWVRIPVSPVAPPVAQNKPDTVHQPAQSVDVLVAEDNEINGIVVREMLTAAGHTVTLARNGKEAVNLAQHQRFDLILLDISMPVMDGVSACRAIRMGRGASQDAPIHALTASALRDERRAFVAAGMNGVLTKPLSHDALTAVLAGLLPAVDPEPVDAPMLTMEQIDDMRETLGPEAVAGLATRFAKEAEWLVDWLEDCQQLPQQEIVARVHRVSGSAAVFGATAFRAFLLEIETLAKQNRLEDIHLMLPELSDRWHATSAALQRTIAA